MSFRGNWPYSNHSSMFWVRPAGVLFYSFPGDDDADLGPLLESHVLMLSHLGLTNTLWDILFSIGWWGDGSETLRGLRAMIWNQDCLNQSLLWGLPSSRVSLQLQLLISRLQTTKPTHLRPNQCSQKILSICGFCLWLASLRLNPRTDVTAKVTVLQGLQPH
jgi:hypothetical protein